MTCALAHPFYAVGTPRTARHLRRLADLFGNWEVRDGSRAKERNRPAAAYITTHDGIGIGIGIGIGGSDDHAGVDIGRTFTDAGLRERLTLAALASVRNRTWKAALRRLADGYDRVRAGRRAAGRRAAGAREAEVARAT